MKIADSHARQQMQINCQLDPRFHELPFLKAAVRAEEKTALYNLPSRLPRMKQYIGKSGRSCYWEEIEENTEDTKPDISVDPLSVMYEPEIMQAQRQLSKRKKKPSKMNLWPTWKKHCYHQTTVRWSGGSWRRLYILAAAAAAKRVLGILATSILSERIFSKTGLLLTTQRKRLSGDTVNKLIFLACNKNI